MEIGLILAICAMSLVCLGVIFVVGFWLIRAVGGSVINPLASLMGDVDEDIENEPEFARGSSRLRRPTESSIRQKRQSLDFDAAVQRHREDSGASSPADDSTGRASLRRPGAGAFNKDYDAKGPSAKERRRRRNDDYEVYDDGEDGFFEL